MTLTPTLDTAFVSACGTSYDPALILAGSFHAEGFLIAWLILCCPVLLIGLSIIWGMSRKIEDDTGEGMNLTMTGILAGLIGLLAPALWLTWSGYSETPLEFSLPAPNRFPQWQIIALAVTFFVPILVVAFKMRRPIVGAVALALGASIGSATAMTIDVAFVDSSSQEGIGIVLALVGVGILTLGVGEIVGIPRGMRAGVKGRRGKNGHPESSRSGSSN